MAHEYDESHRLRQTATDTDDAISQRPEPPGLGSFSVVGVIAAATPTNDVQTVSIDGTPTGGTFTLAGKSPLTGLSFTTAAIAYNANAAAVQAALTALAGIGSGQVVGSGGPLPGTPVVLTFQGTWAQKPVGTLRADGTSLTGGTTPSAGTTHTTWGDGPFPTNPHTFFKVDLGTILGDESEGASGVITTTTTAYVFNLGSHLPTVGQSVRVTAVPYRLVMQV